jgi:hypothetical protein
MEGPLPEQFPFRKRPAPPSPDAPEPSGSAPSELPAAPAAAAAAPLAIDTAAASIVERVVEPEALVEVACGPRVVYRGRERRRSPRQALRAKAVFRDDARPAAGGPVQVVNISMFGVRLWAPRPLSAADRGHFRLELGPLRWASKVRVVTCAPNDDDGYVIGCEFVANEVAPRRRVTDAA